MQSKEMFLALCLVLASMLSGCLDGSDNTKNDLNNMVDPLVQDEGHDHRNASQHQFWTDNVDFVSYNPLTKPGNAEVQVALSPDGNTYAYQAGCARCILWPRLHVFNRSCNLGTILNLLATHIEKTTRTQTQTIVSGLS